MIDALCVLNNRRQRGHAMSDIITMGRERHHHNGTLCHYCEDSGVVQREDLHLKFEGIRHS